MRRYFLTGLSQNSKRILLLIILLLCGKDYILAQALRDTDHRTDQNLKSIARVNPSTLAMEFSLPLMTYPGRGGNSFPVTFDYSSKLWTMKHPDILEPTVRTDIQGGTGSEQNPYRMSIITSYQTQYSERAFSGWNISGMQPITQMENDGWFDFRDESGERHIRYINRLRFQMPDGSTKEFRANDKLYDCRGFGGFPADDCSNPSAMGGTYLAADGSGMRYSPGSTSDPVAKIFLPDGGIYKLISGGSYEYIDKNGNKTVYDHTTNKITDTLGREIINPLAAGISNVGVQNFNLPGLGGQNLTYGQKWGPLKPAGCVTGTESACQDAGLENPSDALYYLDNDTCADQNYDNPINSGETFLFQVDPHRQETRIEQVEVYNVYYQDTYKDRMCYSSGASPVNPGVLTEITLPDGSKYKFRYNRFGEMTKIIYPTGAYERFRYENNSFINYAGGIFGQTSRGVVERWVSIDGVIETQHWKYGGQMDGQDENGQGFRAISTVAPDGTKTLRTVHSPGMWSYYYEDPRSGMALEEKIYSPPSVPNNEQTRTLLRRKLTDWQNAAPRPDGNMPRDARPAKTVSIVFEPNASHALATMTETVYDTNSDMEYFAHLNAKQVKTYNYITLDLTMGQTATIETISALFSNSNLAVVKEAEYLYDANYKPRNLTQLPVETKIKDASGTIKAKSQISYDQTNFLEVATVANAPGWTNQNTSYRGLPTTTRSWSDVANNQSIETHALYDQFGNVRKTWDGRGNYSEIQHADNYTDGTNRNSYALPTKTISYAGANGSGTVFESTVKYDFNTGLVRFSTDVNGQISEQQYNTMLRPYKTIAPNGHQTITEYGTPVANGQLPANQRFVKVKTQIDEQKWKEAYTWFDGIGRTIKTQSVDSNGDVFVDTEYDSVGRVWRTTNPYRAGETVFKTENFYDAAGRHYKVKTPDNAEVETFYSLATTGGQIGTVVTVDDQANKQRRSITNALGQLTRVDEPNDNNQLGAIDNPNQATLYSYDTLSNLMTVSQGIQTRNFIYDSLSRLKTATNPESGLIQYVYDNNGNLTQKTDARLVVTNYVYDALNRVTNRNYSNEPDGHLATPNVVYKYDDVSFANSKGKLTKVTNGFSATEYTEFDLVGRVKKSRQTTDGTAYDPMEYTYNLSGALVEQKYPSGRVVKNVLDNDGELLIVQSKKNQTSGFWNYAKNITTTASGVVSSMQLGNGKWESTQFNSRLQPTQIALGTVQNGTDRLKLNFDYGMSNNNGNILSQTITVPTVGNNTGFTAIQIYNYDSLNRLRSAEEKISNVKSWKQSFIYDLYGNRNLDVTNTTTPNHQNGVLPKVVNPEILPSNNRFKTDQDNDGINDYIYDANGSIIKDATDNRFKYNAEGKQIIFYSSDNSSQEPSAVYFYDGSDKRVKKIVGNKATIYIYDIGERLVAEYTVNAQINENPQVLYTTSDHLDSPRIISDKIGQVSSRSDYLPFGEEIYELGGRTASLNYVSGNVDQKFTGKQRDVETGLDYFGGRYYSSIFGRFMNPDKPFLDQDEVFPQSWNIYTYTRNNPLRYVDESGYEIFYATPELKAVSDALRAKSTTYDAALKGFEGEGSPNLNVGFGNAGFDADGKTKAIGLATNSIYDEKPPGQDWDDKLNIPIPTPGVPAKLDSSTIIIDDSINNDASKVEETLEHEVGHADHGRRKPKEYLDNSTATKKEKGKTPHDKRPNEVIANNFQKAVVAEKKATEKVLEQQKKNEESQKKQDEKKRKQEEKQKRKQANLQ
jgi:RHS repeat-associated protein